RSSSACSKAKTWRVRPPGSSQALHCHAFLDRLSTSLVTCDCANERASDPDISTSAAAASGKVTRVDYSSESGLASRCDLDNKDASARSGCQNVAWALRF